jgi:hypothetical protein
MGLLAILLSVPTASLAVPVQYIFSGTLASNTGSDPLQLQGALLRSDVFADTSDLPVFVAGSETISARYTPASAITSIAGRPGGAAALAIESPGPLQTRNNSFFFGDEFNWAPAAVTLPESLTEVLLPGFVVALFIDTAIGVAAPLPLFAPADVESVGTTTLGPADLSNLFSYRLTNPSASAVVVPEPGTTGLVFAGLALIARRARSTSGASRFYTKR